MLAEDQIQAVKEINAWYHSSKAYHILTGGAGVGKSFVVDTILKELPRISPVLIAPTHKAVNQLKEKTKGDYDFRTVANSLGIRPVDDHGKHFEQVNLPSFWENINIAVIDEASMLNGYQWNLYKSIGMKILLVGHKSQLPSVERHRSVTDKCISHVFDQGYSESLLYLPKRNVGKLWEFNNLLEQKIYDQRISIPLDYDIGRNDLIEYISIQSDEFLLGKTKVALWTNEGVNRYNTRIRKAIFKEESFQKYLKYDLVIFANIFTSFDGMEYMNDKTILNVAGKSLDVYTDTDGSVLSVKEVTVTLNKHLVLQCYKLEILTEVEGRIFAYELKHTDDYKRVADFYEHIAWGFTSKQAKDKAYRERATILKCFAKVKYFYAATAHRLQGSSVPNIIAIVSDINKNSNRIERAKCDYVASSRCIDNLYRYRGV